MLNSESESEESDEERSTSIDDDEEFQEKKQKKSKKRLKKIEYSYELKDVVQRISETFIDKEKRIKACITDEEEWMARIKQQMGSDSNSN